MYVIGSDGHIPSKIEVYAKIGKSSSSFSNGNVPAFHPPNPFTFSRPDLSFANNPPPNIANNPPGAIFNKSPINYFPLTNTNSNRPRFQQKTYPEPPPPPPRVPDKAEKPIQDKTTHLTRLKPVESKPTDEQNKTEITTINPGNKTQIPIEDERKNEILPFDQPVTSPPELTATLVPIVSVCAVFLTVGIFAIVFRKKICLLKSDDSKDDMVNILC